MMRDARCASSPCLRPAAAFEHHRDRRTREAEGGETFKSWRNAATGIFVRTVT
jgi:hypothetical protein